MVVEIRAGQSGIYNKISPQVSFKMNDMLASKNTYEKFVFKQNTLSGKAEQPKSSSNNKKDLLLEYPMRALGYTNEIGEALRPAVGHFAANLFWVPALMYFGADIWDKYKRGEDDSYQNNDKRAAFRQAVFHSIASLAGPTIAIHAAQDRVMKWGGKEMINKAVNDISREGSKLASKIGSIPLVGKKIVNLLKNPALSEKYLKGAFKTGIGFAALALVAIPLDILTEKLVIKKVVNPSLGLKDQHNKSYHA